MRCRKLTQLGFAAFMSATAMSLPASAADVHDNGGSLKDVPEVYAAPRNWEGFYFGGHLGYGWGEFEASDVDPVFLIDEDLDHEPEGWLYGAQIGYNWQWHSKWVFGVEADIAGSDVDGDASYDFVFAPGDAFVQTQSMELEYFATVRARLGYDLGKTLLFVTGGWAFAQVDIDFDTAIVGPGPIPDTGFLASADSSHDGWVIGGGFETWLRDNVSLKVEYLYADLDEEVYQPVATVAGEPFEFTIQTVRVGINFHF